MGEDESEEQRFTNHPSSSSLSSTEAEQSLIQAIELITTLTTLSHTVRVFSSRWQIIRTKLEELNSGLIAVDHCHTTHKTQPLANLLLAIKQTVTECTDLAHRCIDITYSGKLLMQSDLDSISAKLDTHITALSGVHAAGVLSNGFAIVVSRPGPGASKDDMRFYVKDLATRMKIGDKEMKRQAMEAVNEIVSDDEKYVRVVIECGDIVGLLVRFLDSGDGEMRYEAVKVMEMICGYDSYKSVVVMAGIMAPLIRLLEEDEKEGGDGKVLAIKCLMKLTENSENAWSVSAHGGVTALLKICFDEGSESEMIGPACMVLRNIMGVDEVKRFMVEEGAISSFVKLITRSKKDEESQVNAIEFLQSMACGDESVRQMVINDGIIPALTHILDHRSQMSIKSREAALKAVESLCFTSRNGVNLLIRYGFMDHLLYFLRRGEVSIQELAFKVSVRLCGTPSDSPPPQDEMIKKTMGELGYMSEFVKFLQEGKSYEIKEMAAEAVSEMVVSVTKNKKRFVQEERNVAVVMEMLGGGHQQRKMEGYLVRVVAAVCGECGVTRRRKIVGSVAGWKRIQKLAEEGNPDAKKIVKKVSGNRLQNIVRKILH